MKFEKALQILDTALLMGGDLFRDKLEYFIGIINNNFQESKNMRCTKEVITFGKFVVPYKIFVFHNF